MASPARASPAPIEVVLASPALIKRAKPIALPPLRVGGGHLGTAWASKAKLISTEPSDDRSDSSSLVPPIFFKVLKVSHDVFEAGLINENLEKMERVSFQKQQKEAITIAIQMCHYVALLFANTIRDAQDEVIDT
ncbi:hypothetical protein COCNU_15G001380 [Cocos nucifera]|uniref:Uncharacterized protein n=1 Tax=Cocos nucifera TaxID=13894 RepID=A0A8K0NCY2_COCNU|nr:hypothetical protein COCNU_15G001380 [Cocos nucifera]